MRLLLNRDIEHVISEGPIPDTKHPDESRHVTEVREARDAGEDGVQRMRGMLDEDEMSLFQEYVLITTGLTHPGWASDSHFRMWREHRGVWSHTVGPVEQRRTVTVTYGEWRGTLAATGLPFTKGHRGTAALQRHLLLTTDARAKVMRERLAEVRGDSTSAGEHIGGAVRASKKTCIRMISNKSSTFSGGSGETLKDPTEGLARRIEERH